MDASQALGIIQTLADGVDPIMSEVFPDNSPYQHPQIIRALFVAIKALERVGERQKREQQLPTIAGKPWNDDEDRLLREGFDTGMTINQLAEKHQRTRGAIQSRLIKLGKLEVDASS